MTSTLVLAPPAAITIAAENEYPHVYPSKSWAAQTHMEGRSGPYVEVSEQQANEYVRLYFTQGQCHALAMAIEELTDCTLMGSDWSGDVPNHVFVKLPNGLGLDICGLVACGEHPDKLFHDDWREITLEEVHGLPYVEPRMDIARPYAKMLVNWYCQ